MKTRLPFLLLVVCAAGFAFGIMQLFRLRFAMGDVYPEYSSLRADPLGAMAFCESLDKLPGISVRRDYSAVNQLPEGHDTTYLHLAARPEEWRRLPADTFKEIDGFLVNGGRLVVTFFPEPIRRFRFLQDDGAAESQTTPLKPKPKNDKESPGADPEKRKRRGANAEDDSLRLQSLKERWGVQFSYEPLAASDDGTYASTQARTTAGEPLPEHLEWHSGLIFTNLGPAWRTVYARGTNAVVIERKFGSGTVVMATDSFFLSNEAMRQERHAGLLAWLVGANRRVYFDEAHLGIMETSGVATLMRKYRLHGLMAGLVLLAALFIWKNSMSLVPRLADEAPQGQVAGKDAAAGFVNLLRRNIPAREVLQVCFAEWTKSLRHSGNYTIAAVDQAQAVMEAEAARDRRRRDPVKAYQEICRVLRVPGSGIQVASQKDEVQRSINHK